MRFRVSRVHSVLSRSAPPLQVVYIYIYMYEYMWVEYSIIPWNQNSAPAKHHKGQQNESSFRSNISLQSLVYLRNWQCCASRAKYCLGHTRLTHYYQDKRYYGGLRRVKYYVTSSIWVGIHWGNWGIGIDRYTHDIYLVCILYRKV